MKLEDLKIIVTGGASGMGAHFARRLHEAGAKVAVATVFEEGVALRDAYSGRRVTVQGGAVEVASAAPAMLLERAD